MPVTIHQAHGDWRMFKPTIETGGVSASFGSINTADAASVTYNAILCVICRNIVNDKSSGSNPLEITMSDYDKIIVIPYRLATYLLTTYDEDEITRIIRQHRERLDRVFTIWAKTGDNICKKYHVGQKFRIKTRDIVINCWIIIDCTNPCYIRISYGGGKIQCP